MALVADDCLIPTRDAPELGYVKESTNEQYVPDVFYKVLAVDTSVQSLLSIVKVADFQCLMVQTSTHAAHSFPVSGPSI